MKRLMNICLAAVGAVGLAACGGNKTTSAIQDNAPTFSAVGMDMASSDSNAPSSSGAALTPGDGSCHPYLFARTRNVVRRLNWHLYKTLYVMDHVIKEHPSATAGATATWTRSGPRYTVQVVGTKVSDTEFTYDISLKKSSEPDSSYVKVTSADVKLTGSAGSADGGADTRDESGTLHFDYSAFASVVAGDTAQGTLDYDFNLSGQSKTIEAKLANFLPDGADGVADISPRNAHYVFTREKGVGGSLKYTDELILACPLVNGAANTTARSDVDTVFRWTHKADGSVVARGDTQASAQDASGNIPQGDKIVGVTCGTWDNGNGLSTEKYWMMKLEGSSGGTVVSGTFSYDSDPTTDPTTACDAAFGPVPTTTDASQDYDFTQVNFTDSSTITFPAQG